MQVSLLNLEAWIEKQFYDYLSDYFQSFKVIHIKSERSLSESYDNLNKLNKLLIPINKLPSSFINDTLDNHVVFRTFNISSCPLVLSTHWNLLQLNHLLIHLPEFQNKNVTLDELNQNALMHYKEKLISNTSNIVNSMEQFGAPINFIRLIKRGFNMFISTAKRSFNQGPYKFITGLYKASFMLFKHVVLGIIYTIWCFANGWAKTLEYYKSTNYITNGLWPVIKVLNVAKLSSGMAIGYILNSMDNGEEVD